MTDVLERSILLGRGGRSPGIEAYGAISGDLEKMLSLPAGHSVYAIDISSDGIVAAGSKTGAIHWLTQQEPGNENHG